MTIEKLLTELLVTDSIHYGENRYRLPQKYGTTLEELIENYFFASGEGFAWAIGIILDSHEGNDDTIHIVNNYKNFKESASETYYTIKWGDFNNGELLALIMVAVFLNWKHLVLLCADKLTKQADKLGIKISNEDIKKGIDYIFSKMPASYNSGLQSLYNVLLKPCEIPAENEKYFNF